MSIYDPLFITFIFLIFFMFLGVLISRIAPKNMHMESSDSAIRKGKYVGSVIGISIGLFIYFYFFKNNFFGLLDRL